jgi:hypothetical protein
MGMNAGLIEIIGADWQGGEPDKRTETTSPENCSDEVHLAETGNRAP